jgi:uncharacterized metal-binding protein YceD (DUF177 family)
MKQTSFVFEIGDLVREEQGTIIRFDFDEENTLEFDEGQKPKSNISAKVALMKVQDGIHVLFEDIQLSLEFNCMKCGLVHEQKIVIPQAERVYYFKKQKEDADSVDFFYVDTKSLTIDISDFLRQEIILHFPTISVCSKSCKGLCSKCGTNLNKKTCKCPKDTEREKPLAGLKKLIK